MNKKNLLVELEKIEADWIHFARGDMSRLKNMYAAWR